jgi:hypothetical protein
MMSVITRRPLGLTYYSLSTMRDDSEIWACCSSDMVTLKHYRMSLDVVARPLTSFCSSLEFVSAITDAMEGTISFAELSNPYD